MFVSGGGPHARRVATLSLHYPLHFDGDGGDGGSGACRGGGGEGSGSGEQSDDGSDGTWQQGDGGSRQHAGSRQGTDYAAVAAAAV